MCCVCSVSATPWENWYVQRHSRCSPLPPLTWADRQLVWQQMCIKDNMYRRSPDLLNSHPALQHRMRAILLDWISEVCVGRRDWSTAPHDGHTAGLDMRCVDVSCVCTAVHNSYCSFMPEYFS